LLTFSTCIHNTFSEASADQYLNGDLTTLPERKSLAPPFAKEKKELPRGCRRWKGRNTRHGVPEFGCGTDEKRRISVLSERHVGEI